MSYHASDGAAGEARRLARIQELERDIAQMLALERDYAQAIRDLPIGPRYDQTANTYERLGNEAGARAADLERRRDALLAGKDEVHLVVSDQAQVGDKGWRFPDREEK